MHQRRLTTDVLDLAYLELGPPDGPPVLMLHGFPDDATAHAEVMAAVAAQGRRAIAPYLRGVGPTRFRDPATPRAADFAALGQDALDLVDALDLRDAIVVGQDWGSPTAEIVASQRPERVSRLVKLNWYGVYSMAEMSRAQGFRYEQLRTLWYVWMLNLPLGEMVMQYDPLGFCRTLWNEWSPTWNAEAREAAFAQVSASFENPDFARVVLAAYRDATGQGELDPRHDALRQRLQATPPVTCPTVVMRGADDGVERTPLSAEAIPRYFTGAFREEVLPGVGHFPQREAPAEVVRAILEG